MPYLKNETKDSLLDHPYPTSAGELNFLLTTMCRRYFNKSARNYEAYNTVIGALECCKLEYYRKQVSLYENEKEKENGTVW